jgi:3,5-epimerase/4-reductase
MRWLLYGAKGWIGTMVKEELKKENQDSLIQEEVHEGVARADDEVGVEADILRVRPNRIMCFIGRTHGPGYATIDYLEQKGKLVENVQDNLYAPLVLALLGAKHNIHVTYLGTGCIFSNTPAAAAPFTEQDRPNFFGSGYSTVKGFTDRLLTSFFTGQVLNLRIRMPIVGHHHPRNFITKIVNYEKICSIPNSMTVLEDMVPVMIRLALERTTGTVNLTNPGVISHNEILALYKEFVEPSFTWQNFSLAEQAQVLLSERSNNALDTTLLQTLAPEVPDIHTSVRRLMQDFLKKM